MRYIFLLLLLLLSGCYYPYYGYPYYGYPYPTYAPGYQPNYYSPNNPPSAYRGPPSAYDGPPPYSSDQQQSYSGSSQLRYGTGPYDPQNCGTPYDPEPCSGPNR
jgi:hypothetical protein